jgi:hypothetical protein
MHGTAHRTKCRRPCEKNNRRQVMHSIARPRSQVALHASYAASFIEFRAPRAA